MFTDQILLFVVCQSWHDNLFSINIYTSFASTVPYFTEILRQQWQRTLTVCALYIYLNSYAVYIYTLHSITSTVVYI